MQLKELGLIFRLNDRNIATSNRNDARCLDCLQTAARIELETNRNRQRQFRN